MGGLLESKLAGLAGIIFSLSFVHRQRTIREIWARARTRQTLSYQPIDLLSYKCQLPLGNGDHPTGPLA